MSAESRQAFICAFKVLPNPVLQRLSWDTNRSTDANDGQLAGSYQGAHLRPTKPERRRHLGDS
jgi:hypothetical protein